MPTTPKLYRVVDRGDAIEIRIQTGKEIKLSEFRYDKDNKGFIPSSVLRKIHELHSRGYKELI